MALDLGADEIGGVFTADEVRLLDVARAVESTPRLLLDETRAAIRAGADPLGDELCRVWQPAARRAVGAFYTPAALVAPMLDWALAQDPRRLVDPGCGSGRFAAGAVRRRPDLDIVAIDFDPVATLLTRAALATLGARSATVRQIDYTAIELPHTAGRTAFVGNPPYVRHHDLSAAAKGWALAVGRRLGHPVSALAGLHAYFYLATALYAHPDDIGCFVTSAEWLDVKYGAIIRHLLLDRLGGHALHVLDPQAVPFTDAMTTAAITCFRVGQRPASMRFRRIATSSELTDLTGGTVVERARLVAAHRWTPLLLEPTEDDPNTRLPLRDVARVHRGVVTGANDFFVLSRDRARELGLEQWCRPAITRSTEIFAAGGIIRDAPERKVLLDVPAHIDRTAHPQLDAYLAHGELPIGEKPPVAARYIASRRRPWWSLGAPSPSPIVATYMARQAPAFALNPDGLVLLNIAHGIYPLEPMTSAQLDGLVTALNQARESFRGGGRTYHGGLEKYEPSEMEALLIPAPSGWR